MATVAPERCKEAWEYIGRLRANPKPGTGMRQDEVALMAAGDMLDELLASCRELSRLLSRMADSKKIAFTDEQRSALMEPYGRAVAAITNAGGEP